MPPCKRLFFPTSRDGRQPLQLARLRRASFFLSSVGGTAPASSSLYVFHSPQIVFVFPKVAQQFCFVLFFDTTPVWRLSEFFFFTMS